MKMHCNLNERGYDIILEKGCLQELSKYLDCKRRYFIISDSGVPKDIVLLIRSQLSDANVFLVEQGEASKCIDTYQLCLKMLLQKKYTRSDCVIAVGGGVVGDLAGFVAASYMRGIDFINIPTTTLAQIDSSIGGKVAIDLDGVKNCVGAFWQPQLVLIDSTVLKSLSTRHFFNGLVEALKTGLIADKELFELFEREDYLNYLDEIIEKSLEVKRKVVEEDEKETGLRKILNFGHTIGHGIESATQFKTYYHGECVGLGMIAILENEEIKERVKKVLVKMNCPIQHNLDSKEIFKYISNDKKAEGLSITIVQVPTIGKFELIRKNISELEVYCEEVTS